VIPEVFVKMAQQDDLNVGRIALIGLVSGLLLVAIILFLQVLYYGYYQGMMASPQYDQLPAEMTNYVADQQGKLVTIRVVDQEREVVTIPIDDAQRLVIDELSADPQAHVTGVPDPEPASPPEEEESATGDQPPTADTPTENDDPADVESPPVNKPANNGEEVSDDES
jgi:hypothetical protein